AAVERALKVLMDTVASLNRRSDDAAALLRETRERLDAAVKAGGGADPAQIAQLSARIAALERTGKTLEDELGKRTETAISDRAGRLPVAASALESAVVVAMPCGALL